MRFEGFDPAKSVVNKAFRNACCWWATPVRRRPHRHADDAGRKRQRLLPFNQCLRHRSHVEHALVPTTTNGAQNNGGHS